MLPLDLKGQKFNRLTVVGRAPSKRSKSNRSIVMWECKCDCGNTIAVMTSNLRTGTTKSCGCLNNERRSERFKGNRYSLELQIKGTKNIKQSYFKQIIRNSKKRNREVTITIEYIQSLLENQNFKCAISGIPIEMDHFNTKKRGRYNTASLDRIDSSKGYIEGNVQWVHKDINSIKSNFNLDRFIELCISVATHHQKSIIKSA